MIGVKCTAEEKAAIEALAERLGYPNVPELVRDGINLLAQRAKQKQG